MAAPYLRVRQRSKVPDISQHDSLVTIINAHRVQSPQGHTRPEPEFGPLLQDNEQDIIPPIQGQSLNLFSRFHSLLPTQRPCHNNQHLTLSYVFKLSFCTAFAKSTKQQ